MTDNDWKACFVVFHGWQCCGRDLHAIWCVIAFWGRLSCWPRRTVVSQMSRLLFKPETIMPIVSVTAAGKATIWSEFARATWMATAVNAGSGGGRESSRLFEICTDIIGTTVWSCGLLCYKLSKVKGGDRTIYEDIWMAIVCWNFSSVPSVQQLCLSQDQSLRWLNVWYLIRKKVLPI